LKLQRTECTSAVGAQEVSPVRHRVPQRGTSCKRWVSGGKTRYHTAAGRSVAPAERQDPEWDTILEQPRQPNRFCNLRLRQTPKEDFLRGRSKVHGIQLFGLLLMGGSFFVATILMTSMIWRGFQAAQTRIDRYGYGFTLLLGTVEGLFLTWLYIRRACAGRFK
jgi:hypothetical protein